jgi:hypothetical protein
MIKRNWTKTLIENVYMAKLAVLISSPRMWMTHCGVAMGPDGDVLWPEEVWFMLFEHGTVGSVESTPLSRASCSMVIGMNDPGASSVHCTIIPGRQLTHPADHEHLGGPGVGVEAAELLEAGGPGVLALVLAPHARVSLRHGGRRGPRPLVVGFVGHRGRVGGGRAAAGIRVL